MSLIADALKKAQSARLGRRYAVPDPSGVLPRAREPRRPAKGAPFGSVLNQVQLSPTLLIGLGSGVVLFVVLFSYFFLSGRGLRVQSTSVGSPAAVAARPADLLLTPPPALPSVEPLILEDKAPAGDRAEAKAPRARESQPAKGAGKPEPKPAKATEASRGLGLAREAKGGAKGGEAPSVSVTPELSEEVRQQFNLALFYQEEKNYAQARGAYEKVVQMWPLYSEAHNNLGVVYKELGLYGEAIAQLKKALALNPRYTMAQHNLGVIYHLQGDWKQAVKSYQAALALDRSHLSSYNNLGLVYRAQKRAHEAREVLEKALGINPAFAQTHYNLALVLEEIREPERARFHFQKFIDLSGDENQALVQRVRAHLQEASARQ